MKKIAVLLVMIGMIIAGGRFTASSADVDWNDVPDATLPIPEN